MSDLPKYEYECSKGHAQAANHEMTKCLAWKCEGELKRVGKGSRGTK